MRKDMKSHPTNDLFLFSALEGSVWLHTRMHILEGVAEVWRATTRQRQRLHSGTDFPALTYGDRGDLGIKIQHPVAIHVHQVIASALFVIAEKVHSFCILGERRDWIRLTAIL